MKFGFLKSIAAIILSAAMLSGCAGGCLQQNTVPPVEVTPPFWVVEDVKTGGTLYLLGSMHAGKQGTEYPDYIMNAYNESPIIAAELDTITSVSNYEILSEATEQLLLKDTTAKECFGDDYDEVVSFMRQKGLYSDMLEQFVPYYWGSCFSAKLVQDAGLSTDFGTENIFLTMAHRDKKTVVEIESLFSQYKMMAEMPMDYQVYVTTSCVGEENYKKQVADTLELYNAWSSFDEDYFEQLNVDGDIPEELAESSDVYMNKMYLERQRIMADKAVDFLKSGQTVFMLVGAAHYYIEEDILTLLENQGYSVKAVCSEDMAA